MATLQQAKKNAQKLKNLDKALFDYIRKIEKNFLTLEKERIFVRSKDIFGDSLGYYSLATEFITEGKKKAGDPFTGVDTGDFFKGFYLKVSNNRVYFSSTDEKTADILKSGKTNNGKGWMTDEIFGLDDDDLNLIIQENLLPFIQLTIKKRLGI